MIISIQEELNMKDYKLLNLKNMKETIVNYSGDQKEFDKIWDASTRWLVSSGSMCRMPNTRHEQHSRSGR